PFIPKPHTPFQCKAQMPIKELIKREQILLKNLRREGYNVKCYDVKTAVIQTILSRGDQSVGDVIETAVKYGGTWLAWRKAVEKHRFEEGEFLKEMDENNLPWKFIKI
ncbi:MAG: hypothetical protein QW327_06085, partial [Candidatus Odinarchaeota archaeon]